MAQALDPVTMAKMSIDNGQKPKGEEGRYFLSLCCFGFGVVPEGSPGNLEKFCWKGW